MMEEYNGAEWVRVDLHLHSPVSKTFSLPSGFNLDSDAEKQRFAGEYVQKLKDAEIEIGAITDHNIISDEWFNLIKGEAESNGIVLFPGVELSLKHPGKGGLHILTIFERDVDIKGVNTFLHSLDKNPQDSLHKGRNHRVIDPKQELEELIEEVRSKYNCLIVFAHPEESNGLMKAFDPGQAAKYLRVIKPDAVEYISDESKHKLLSTNEFDKDFFESLAVIEVSDPKNIDEIGQKRRNNHARATYLKLSDVSIDALKLALHDPTVRVRLYAPPEMYHSRISRLIINGTTFLKDLETTFNPEMNTLIGGRGVGKSSIIEAIRYALDLPVYHEKSFRIEFVEDVVGSGGEIRVYVDRFYGEEKKCFEIRRIIGKEPSVYDLDGGAIDLTPNDIFEEEQIPILFGQKELYFVANDRKFQLELVDDLIGREIGDKQLELRHLVERLKGNGRAILSVREKLGKKGEYEQRIKSIDAEIRIFKELGVVDKLKRYTDLLEDEERIKKAKQKLSEMHEEITTSFENYSEDLFDLESMLKKGKSENRNILLNMSKAVRDIGVTAKESGERILDGLNEGMSGIDEFYNYWIDKKKPVEEEVRTIKMQLGEQKLHPERLEELTKEKARIEPVLRELQRYETKLSRLYDERKELKDEIQQKRHEIFKIRDQEKDRINDKLKEKLRVSVLFEEETRRFTGYLKDMLKGSGVGDAVNSLVSSIGKTIDGILLSYYIKQGSEKLIEEFNLTEAKADRIVKWFEDEKKLFELETLFPEDKIEISLRVNGEYKKIDGLSAGQKATALLLLLFAREENPLIIDQPEEDLDNRFIYEDVVKTLRDMKGKRQLIIATHNANIPVLGDSELIIVLESEAGRCKIIDRGSIDKESIRQGVKNIMEGGEEAFMRRAGKYGYGGL